MLWARPSAPAKKVVDRVAESLAKIGVLKVRLYPPVLRRPPAGGAAGAAVAVLDRAKEPGALAEPLYLDVMTATWRSANRGRRGPYRALSAACGLSSRSLVRNACWRYSVNCRPPSRSRALPVGIAVAVTNLSLPLGEIPCRQRPSSSCSTASAAMAACQPPKATSKSSATRPRGSPGGLFVYDSKKAGGLTVSHLPGQRKTDSFIVSDFAG